MARPKKEIDKKQVEKLANLQCTLQEIADWFGVDKSTISRNFATEIEKGKSFGKISIRRAQLQLALKGNATMLIWLGKQYLEQKEKKDDESDSISPYSNLTDQQLKDKTDELIKALKCS